MVYTRSMARSVAKAEVREPRREDAPTESDDSTYAPSDASSSIGESVGSNSPSEDVSVTLGSETRSASSTETDLGGFIVRDENVLADDATSRSPPAHATAIARTERLEREVAEILALLRRGRENR